MLPQYSSEETILGYLLDLYAKLSSESDMSPRNPTVNGLLSQLVSFVTSDLDPVVSSQVIERLEKMGSLSQFQGLCQRAEALMEAHFCNLVISSRN